MSNLYASLGIDTSKLGCVMLDVDDTGLGDHVTPALWYDDPTDALNRYGRETEPHVTLLYGLLESAHTWREQVDEVLADWTPPKQLDVHRLEVFETPRYDCVVGMTGSVVALADAHGALSRLPHINTFPTYKPHITIGYVLPGTGRYAVADILAATAWTPESLHPLARVSTHGINYGRADS